MHIFDTFVTIVKQLRSPNGCIWDKAQTYQSLTKYVIEEAYELVDGMEKESYPILKEELGDVLLHVVMLANMAEEKSKFSIEDVITDVSNKMVRRHPHVFGQAIAETEEDVWDYWDAEKSKEINHKQQSVFDSIPIHLPALLKTDKIQKKIKRLGLEKTNVEKSFSTLDQSLKSLMKLYNDKEVDLLLLEEKAGDILFLLVTVLQRMKINSEDALRRRNNKIVIQAKKLLDTLEDQGKDISSISESERLDLWQESKKDIGFE